MAALSFNNNRRQKTTTATTWSTQRQQLFVRKQFSFIESGGGNNNPNTLQLNSHRGGRGTLTRGLSVGRSYDGIRQKLNAPAVSLRHAGSLAYLQRQITFDQDFKLKSNTKSKDNFTKNSGAPILSSSNTRLNCVRSNGNVDNLKFKEKSIVAWSSASSLLKSFNDDNVGYSRRKNLATDVNGDKKTNDTRKASTKTSATNASNSHYQRSQSLAKGEASKINLSIVLPQAAKTSIDEAVFSDIESSLDSGVDTDTASSQPSKSVVATKSKVATSAVTPTSLAPNSISNTAGYRRAQFRASRIDATIISTQSSLATSITTTTTTSTAANIVPSKENEIQNSQIITNVLNQQSISSNSQTSTTTSTTTTATTTTLTRNFSASPSLSVQRRPPLVRAMSAPVRPIDDSSKGAFAANKKKPRRRKIITRNNSCDKTTEQEFLTTEIINGKKVLSRSRSTISTDVVTLVSLMSSEGSDSEKEDLTQHTPLTGNSTKSETSSVRRAPSLRKTGKSENYPPNFQLASKEYSHMIRRGSIAPLTARLRTNRPPTAPPVSIFLTMTNSAEALTSAKAQSSNAKTNAINDNNDKRTPMSEKPNAANSSAGEQTDQSTEYVFPDYVRTIKERECWKLYQKMCNKGVNVSYDTILRGMLTPTEFRQIQKQRELEESKARELAEAESECDNVKPQSAIDRLSEALLKK